MSPLYYSKLPLPPANYDNNSNVICKPWQLPSLFEKTLSLQDHTSVDRAYRHIAFEPKNKLAYNDTMHLKHELENVHGDIKALHCNMGVDNATVVSFFSITDAKHCYNVLKQKLSHCYKVYFVKPAYIRNNTKTSSAEKMFVVFNSIHSRVDLLNYDYMKHILRFGSVYSISEARISRSCILVNLEYHDERHGEALKANLNCSFIEGAQIMVYSATNDDEIACAHHDTAAAGKHRPFALSMDTTMPISHVATLPPAAAAPHNIMAATPLPSPVADGESYFTVDPYSGAKYHPVSSLPPSPVALQRNDAACPKLHAAVIETLPSSSSNTTFDSCLSKQDDSVSYTAAVQSTLFPPSRTNSNTTTTSSNTPTSSFNPTPSPSPTRSAEKAVEHKKSEEKASAPSSRNSSRRKRPPPSTKKATGNSVDFDKIQSGLDKRTTFMIRNIPNKYTQQMLIDYVNTTHERKYDFLYLRIDFQNKCNVGYAFINFIDPKDAVEFARDRVGKKWQSVCPIFFGNEYKMKLFRSDKKCDLSYANIQGKQALIKKFQNSQVLSEDIAYQPKLFYSNGSRAGQEQPWPYSNNNSSSSHRNTKSHSKDDIAKHSISVNNNTI